MEINSFADRLNILKKNLCIQSYRDFSKRIGISHSNYQSYRKGSSPSLKKLIDILNSVENLNSDWLLFGKDPIFIKRSVEEKNSDAQDIEHHSEKDEFMLTINSLINQISDLIKINSNLSSIIKNNYSKRISTKK